MWAQTGDRLYRELLARVRQLPGVQAASLAQASPTGDIPFSSEVALAGSSREVPTLIVYPGYPSALGLPLVAGRDFGEPDLATDVAPRVLINQTFARQAFPGRNPVGARLVTSEYRGPVSREVIGVVGTSPYADLRGAEMPIIYQPFLQTNTGRGQMVLHVRGDGRAAALAGRVREEVQRVDPHLPLFTVRTLAEEMDAVLVRERLMATLSGFFGGLALLLATVGLYGLFAFTVVRRTAEIGIRMALGATPPRMVQMILREALVLVALGVGIGVPLALAIAHLTRAQVDGLLFGLRAGGPLILAAASAIMGAAALLAAYLPARRAARANPMVALRAE